MCSPYSSDISTQIRSSLIIITFILQLAIYCIGGTLLSQAVSIENFANLNTSK